jgi:hypothetical protein
MNAPAAAKVPAATPARVTFHYEQGHPRARLAAVVVLAAALCGFGYSLGYQRGRAAEEVPSGAAQAVYEEARQASERAERAEQAERAQQAHISRPGGTRGLLGVVNP